MRDDSDKYNSHWFVRSLRFVLPRLKKHRNVKPMPNQLEFKFPESRETKSKRGRRSTKRK
jgi:hypothetical protein